MKHEVKKRVRKITIKRQLERLERGEIDIHDAQNLKTFTRADKPKSKRCKTPSGRKTKPTELKVLNANKKSTAKSSVRINESAKDAKVKAKAPLEPSVSTELPPITNVQPVSDLPPYTDDMILLERESE
ncbi:uncharacterized protein LOC124421330 [Lucilia cuprina]|nr:uncharacterized protein LOC124421330 [Lucilia cuprina]